MKTEITNTKTMVTCSSIKERQDKPSKFYKSKYIKK